jgi:predicted DNA-binding transcriptional regulator AlpA
MASEKQNPAAPAIADGAQDKVGAASIYNREKGGATASVAAIRVRQPKFLLDRRAQYIANLAIGADPDMLLVTKQLAEWLGVSVQWLEIGRSRGYGPPYKKLGRKSIRYRVGDVLKWLDERSHKSTADYVVGEV